MLPFLLSLLGLVRTFPKSKCKELLCTTMKRTQILRSKTERLVQQTIGDIGKLHSRGEIQKAKTWLDQLLRKELCTLFTYDIINKYCHKVRINLSTIAGQRECPMDLKLPIASLCFAASRCSGFPELQEIRAIFTMKYGSYVLDHTPVDPTLLSLLSKDCLPALAELILHMRNNAEKLPDLQSSTGEKDPWQKVLEFLNSEFESRMKKLLPCPPPQDQQAAAAADKHKQLQFHDQNKQQMDIDMLNNGYRMPIASTDHDLQYNRTFHNHNYLNRNRSADDSSSMMMKRAKKMALHPYDDDGNGAAEIEGRRNMNSNQDARGVCTPRYMDGNGVERRNNEEGGYGGGGRRRWSRQLLWSDGDDDDDDDGDGDGGHSYYTAGRYGERFITQRDATANEELNEKWGASRSISMSPASCSSRRSIISSSRSEAPRSCRGPPRRPPPPPPLRPPPSIPRSSSMPDLADPSTAPLFLPNCNRSEARAVIPPDYDTVAAKVAELSAH